VEILDSFFPFRVECRRGSCKQQKVSLDENALVQAVLIDVKKCCLDIPFQSQFILEAK
jgi:hypothetical protein